MTEQEAKEQLQQALIGELVLPLIPVAEQALRDMLTGKKGARDMKAVYLIAELGRDLVLKGADSRDVQKRKAEIMEVVRECLTTREPSKPDEPEEVGFFEQIEAERSGGDGNRAGTRFPAPADHV